MWAVRRRGASPSATPARHWLELRIRYRKCCSLGLSRLREPAAAGAQSSAVAENSHAVGRNFTSVSKFGAGPPIPRAPDERDPMSAQNCGQFSAADYYWEEFCPFLQVVSRGSGQGRQAGVAGGGQSRDRLRRRHADAPGIGVTAASRKTRRHPETPAPLRWSRGQACCFDAENGRNAE